MAVVNITGSDPSCLADDMFSVLGASLYGVSVCQPLRAAIRSDYEEYKASGKVALISGGGSGHEPTHAGFVGRGMLTAAVAGRVFASPSRDSILETIRLVTGEGGCLLIVKNYTGDRLNFCLACEKARLLYGLKVDVLLVGDDVALPVSPVGRRGIAGTVLIHKIAGAAAEKGLSLEKVKTVAEKAAVGLGTIGVGFSPVVVPGAEVDPQRLPEGMLELGMGIHGENGVQQLKRCEVGVDASGKFIKADLLAKEMVEALYNSSDGFGYLKRYEGGRTGLLMINSLGSTTSLELNALLKASLDIFATSDSPFRVRRVVVGGLMTSLAMPGVSMTILECDTELLEMIDHPTDAHGFPRVVKLEGSHPRDILPPPKHSSEAELPTLDSSNAGDAYAIGIIVSVCEALIASESELTRLDTIAGDGDCGFGVKKAAEEVRIRAIKGFLPSPRTLEGCRGMFADIAEVVNSKTEGSTGVLYNILLVKFASLLKSGDAGTPVGWGDASIGAVEHLAHVSGAELGMRTMVDALLPAAKAFAAKSSVKAKVKKEAVDAAKRAAEDGSTRTAEMKAGCGRATYVPFDRLKGNRDPGAHAVAVWIAAIADAWKE